MSTTAADHPWLQYNIDRIRWERVQAGYVDDVVLKSGDIVRFRAGGPKMVLQVIDQDGIALCVWFDVGHLLQQGRIWTRDLEFVSRPAPRSGSPT